MSIAIIIGIVVFLIAVVGVIVYIVSTRPPTPDLLDILSDKIVSTPDEFKGISNIDLTSSPQTISSWVKINSPGSWDTNWILGNLNSGQYGLQIRGWFE
ncbi:MAG: hypothetical protein EB137_05500, partial [Actinobacteria bacterium]|nr:hypothetical protein [Actinomycetota bacterium]